MPDDVNEIPPEGLKVTRTVTSENKEIRLGFTWHGGAYIDVCRVLNSPSGGAGRWCTPVEVINVWNSATDKSRIPRTRAALAKRVDVWIMAYGPDSLVHDVLQNWSAFA